MKVSNIKDIQKFFDVVDSCAGQTEPEIQTFPVCIYGKYFLKRRDSGA